MDIWYHKQKGLKVYKATKKRDSITGYLKLELEPILLSVILEQCRYFHFRASFSDALAAIIS